MKEAFKNFIDAPSRESYLYVRALVISSEEYQPYSDEFEAVEKLYEQEKVTEALETLRSAMPNLLLSPQAHFLASFLHSKTGNEQFAKTEMMISAACTQGILSTGDGTADQPYIVMRTTDEYDILKQFDKELETQSLTQVDGKHIDHMRCTDNSEYWFDISDAYNHLSDSLGE